MPPSSYAAGKDFYKILRVAPGAGIPEIKASYRKLAMQLHPDRNNGCRDKMQEFKLVTEAYTTLTDARSRGQYDFEAGHAHNSGNGFNFNRNRRTAPPKNYRKVYAPRPPPNWKRTWDHNKHFNMHYADGFQTQAIKEATKTAKKNGEFDYHSPLGQGFTFSQEKHADNRNPYSKKAQQGPKKVVFDYEEGSVNSSGKQTFNKRERVVQDLHSQRDERQVYQAEKLRRQQQRHNATFATDHRDEQCIIL